MCMWEYICTYVHTYLCMLCVCAGEHWGHKQMLDFWELQVGMSCLVWLLETELVSSERAADVPNDPNISFLILKIMCAMLDIFY